MFLCVHTRVKNTFSVAGILSKPMVNTATNNTLFNTIV